METNYPSLTNEDCVTILRHLDASLTILRRDCIKPTFDEMKIKTLLSVLRGELTEVAMGIARHVGQTFTD